MKKEKAIKYIEEHTIEISYNDSFFDTSLNKWVQFPSDKMMSVDDVMELIEIVYKK